MGEPARRAFLTPHPPILVPEVGRGRDTDISATAEAMRRLATELADDPPDTLVLMSPHAPAGGRSVLIYRGNTHVGSLAQFGAPGVTLEAESDGELAEAIADAAGGDAMLAPPRETVPLDHGAIVPLSFLDREGRFPLVLMSIALAGMATFERVGAAIGAAADHLGRRIVFVGSGDLSHRLSPDAPAGYVPDAKEFDRAIVNIVKRGDLDKLADLDPELVERAGECGLRSIYSTAGYVGLSPAGHEVLSYEGPFGVGYMVARLAD